MPLENSTKYIKNTEHNQLGKARLKNLLMLTKKWTHDFEKGKHGELIVGQYLINEGFQVSPIISWNIKDENVIYDANQRIEQASKTIFSPDFLVCGKEEMFFADSKLKNFKNCLGWVNVRDYTKYQKAIKKFGLDLRIYFPITETREIYVLKRLPNPSKFEITKQSDGDVYIIPKELLKLVGHFD